MRETSRRQLIKTLAIVGTGVSTAGCNNTATSKKNTPTIHRSPTTSTAETTTTTAPTTTTETETETASGEPSYEDIYQRARKAVDEIRKVAREDLSESRVFLGNVNKYRFSILDNYTLPIPEAEEILGEKIPKKWEQSDYRKLLESVYQDRINNNIRYEYMTESPTSDNIEPFLLVDNQLQIDVIQLGMASVQPEKVRTGLVESLKQVLPPNYELDVNVRNLGDGTGTDEAFIESQENYSRNNRGTLQLYLTQKPLGDLAGLGLKGYAPHDGNTVVIHSKVNELFGYDEMDVVETAIHEAGHSVFNLPHSASDNDIMYYTDETDVLEFGQRSKYLIRRYLGSKFEATISEGDGSRLVVLGFTPAKIESSLAEREFLCHLEIYIHDVLEFEDIKNWEFEYEGQASMGEDKVIATRRFNTEETLQIDITIGYFIEDITLHGSS